MKWLRYDLQTTTEYADQIGELLYEFGINGYEQSDHVPLSEEDEKRMYTDIPAQLPIDDGCATLTFYTEIPGETVTEFFSTGSSIRDEQILQNKENTEILPPDILIQRLTERVSQLQQFMPVPLPVITYQIEDDSNWKDKWKENFKPFRIAEDIIIKPSWAPVPKDATQSDLIVVVDPGQAFGTGTHETTKLCLLSLRKYIHDQVRILDAGCGSGILAITSLLLGAHSAYCLDIDPQAVTGTLENATMNNLDQDKITALNANILENPEQILQQCEEPFDIVVANILADVIIPLADQIRPFLKPGGLFISSGILTDRSESVRQAIEKNGFTILEENTMGEWVSFVAK